MRRHRACGPQPLGKEPARTCKGECQVARRDIIGRCGWCCARAASSKPGARRSHHLVEVCRTERLFFYQHHFSPRHNALERRIPGITAARPVHGVCLARACGCSIQLAEQLRRLSTRTRSQRRALMSTSFRTTSGAFRSREAHQFVHKRKCRHCSHGTRWKRSQMPPHDTPPAPSQL